MIRFVLARLLYAVPIGLAVSAVCFLLAHIAPGDPVNALVPADAGPEVVASVRAQYGLDRPLPSQFVLWVGRVLQGDFGVSIASGRPVADELAQALASTFRLAALAALLGFTLGALLGGLAGAFIGRWPDHLARTVAVFGGSVPHYWLAIVLVIVFAVYLDVLPAVGAGPGGGTGGLSFDWEQMRHYLLPVVTLSLGPMSVVVRNTRGLVAELLAQDFVTALRSRGVGPIGIASHIARNATPTLLAIMGLQVGYLVGGSILVETVFSWPGTGLLLNSAILQRDIPVIQATVLVLALVFVTVNIVVDLLQVVIDPRMRRSGE